ncbi:S41 family peptidase [Flavobacterium sp. KS-LB2]|uniref:S41 family peptidase n=1 Tax=Flavobacterium sp. KS-LB2 TaxID=3120525 RepID=UPI0030D0E48F
MKLRYLCVILLFFFFKISFAQNFYPEIQKLETTAKIWGFLKYYHPEVATGKFNWDEELIKILPKIKAATDTESLSQIYIDWIGNLGVVKNCKNCTYERYDLFDRNFDLSWMSDDKKISQELYAVLKNIEKNRFQGTNFYASPSPAKNILITNEINYEELDYPNESYRLLGLFRYWSIIEYFYPYKYLMDKKWSDVLTQMIPKYINASSKINYHMAIKELVANLDDSHAWISLKDSKSTKFFPYKLKNIDDSCVISGSYNNNITQNESLMFGDVILKINGKSVYDEVQKRMKYTAASNLNRKINFIYEDMVNLESSSVNLTIKRGEEILDKVVNLYNFNNFKYYDSETNIKWKLLEEGNIGYVNMRIVDKKDVSAMMKEIVNCRGIIFDLRGYPKNTFYQISEYINSEKKVFAKIVNPDPSYIGKFVWGNTLTTGHKNKNFYKGKVLILVDEQSLSLSEFAIMCFQTADNAITVGSQSAGADGNVSSFNYLGGFKTAMSGKGVYYPDERETQRLGVKIDYIVKPTILGLKEGKDEILDKAIDIIIKK